MLRRFDFDKMADNVAKLVEARKGRKNAYRQVADAHHLNDREFEQLVAHVLTLEELLLGRWQTLFFD